MVHAKKILVTIFSRNLLSFLLILIGIFTPINDLYALSHDWISGPVSKYGEQLWDKQSIKRNKDGSVRVLSRFIPKTKNEITQDILYTMDINCFEKSFRDVDVFTDEANSHLNNSADWEDPNGDQLIMGVIGQVCRLVD